MIGRAGLVVAITGVLALAPGAGAYLKLGAPAGDRIVALRWPSQPVRYFVTNRGAPGVGAAELQERIARAFATWAAVETANVSSEFRAFVDAEPGESDGASIIGFRSRPDLDDVLGSTSFTIDDVTGELIEADIFLNTIFAWSVAERGETGRYDVESIATHEIGHLFGLGHSALGETTLLETGHRRVTAKRAVMFPIAYPPANIEDRSLEADDTAGLTDLYSTTAARRDFGAVSGRVTLNGVGVFGAHVIAFNPATGATTGGFTLADDGRFVIAGLERGVYVLRAEPLDDADVDSFFDEDVTVNANFRPAYAPRLVVVPAGGSSGSVDIKVSAK